MFELCFIHTRYLLEELETGGNVRFEHGQEGIQWYDHFADYVKGAARLGGLGLVHINKMTRFHHRHFKTCFEASVCALPRHMHSISL
jgi:hypothetical protein